MAISHSASTAWAAAGTPALAIRGRSSARYEVCHEGGSSHYEGASVASLEDLLGVAHASCYAAALRDELEAAGYRPAYVGTVSGVMLARGAIRGAALSCRVEAPGLDPTGLMETARRAARACPATRALGGPRANAYTSPPLLLGSGAYAEPHALMWYVDNAGGLAPEDLIEAAVSGCATRAITAGLRGLGLRPRSLHVQAEVRLGSLEEGEREHGNEPCVEVERVGLTVCAAVPGLDRQALELAVEQACRPRMALAGVAPAELRLEVRGVRC